MYERIATLIEIEGNALALKGTTTYYSQLGLLAKGREIKGFDVINVIPLQK